MWLFRSPFFKSALIAAVVTALLFLSGITTVFIPNAFFLLSSLMILGKAGLLIGFSFKENKPLANARKPACLFFSRCCRTVLCSVLLILDSLSLSFFVTGGVLLLPVLIFGVSLFILICLILSFFE